MPKTLNAVDLDMVNIMTAKLAEWNKDPSSAPRAALMSGSGEKAFCAGGDIVSLYHAHMGNTPDKSIMAQFFAREYLLDYSLSKMDPCQISIWNGITMGGGVGLTWHSPIRIATDNSMYAMPESAIGFFCDVGGSYFLPRVRADSISAGMYLGITGQRVKARDLVKWGLATHFVPADKMSAMRDTLASEVNSGVTNDDIRQMIDGHADLSAKED